jgi:tetratricopeptide (TPR) repeat protein/DNA-binding winged helix-turn-helix (wHTH) protein
VIECTSIVESLRDLSYRLGNLEILPARRTIMEGDEVRPIRAKVFDILLYLIENRGRVVTKEQLIASVWRGVSVTDDSLVQCIVDLRRVLGDDARRPKYIRTLPKVGYQFIGSVEEIDPPDPPCLGPLVPSSVTVEQVTTIQMEVEESNKPAIHATQPFLHKPWRASLPDIGLLALAVGLLGVMVFAQLGRPNPVTRLPRVQGKQSIVVLYFENQSHTADLEWLREGLADMLISDLASSPDVNVLSRQQLATLAERDGWKTDRPLNLADAMSIANKAGAQIFLLGAFASAGDQVRMTVQVHRADDGSLVKTEFATADKRDRIISQAGLLTARLMRDLGVDRRETAGPVVPVTTNLEAYHYYSLGLELLEGMQPPDAIRQLEHAVQLDPEFAAAYMALGNAYTITWGRPPQGKPYYEKAFRFQGRLTERDRLYLLGGYALANSDYTEATRVFQKITARYPDDALAGSRLGRLLEGEGRYGEALKALQAGLIADPNEPTLYNEESGVYCQLGRFAEAFSAASRYVELSHGLPNAYDSLGTANLWFGRYEDADAAYRESLARKPDFPIALIHLAVLQNWQGRGRDALATMERYLRSVSSVEDRARGYDDLACIELEMGENAKAQAYAERAAALSPHNTLPLFLLALNRRDYPAAERLVGYFGGSYSARGSRGSDRPRLYALGSLALAEGRGEEALAHFREALHEPDPVGYMAWLDDCLGNAYLRLGRFDDAIAEYRRVLYRNPNHAWARYHLSASYRAKGETAHADEEYRRFREIWKSADPEAIRTLESARF